MATKRNLKAILVKFTNSTGLISKYTSMIHSMNGSYCIEYMQYTPSGNIGPIISLLLNNGTIYKSTVIPNTGNITFNNNNLFRGENGSFFTFAVHYMIQNVYVRAIYYDKALNVLSSINFMPPDSITNVRTDLSYGAIQATLYKDNAFFIFSSFTDKTINSSYNYLGMLDFSKNILFWTNIETNEHFSEGISLVVSDDYLVYSINCLDISNVYAPFANNCVNDICVRLYNSSKFTDRVQVEQVLQVPCNQLNNYLIYASKVIPFNSSYFIIAWLTSIPFPYPFVNPQSAFNKHGALLNITGLSTNKQLNTIITVNFGDIDYPSSLSNNITYSYDVFTQIDSSMIIFLCLNDFGLFKILKNEQIIYTSDTFIFPNITKYWFNTIALNSFTMAWNRVDGSIIQQSFCLVTEEDTRTSTMTKAVTINNDKSILPAIFTRGIIGNFSTYLPITWNIISQLYNDDGFYISTMSQGKTSSYSLTTQFFVVENDFEEITITNKISSTTKINIIDDNKDLFLGYRGFTQVLLKNSSILIASLTTIDNSHTNLTLSCYNKNLKLNSQIIITSADIWGPPQICIYRDEILVGWSEFQPSLFSAVAYIVSIDSNTGVIKYKKPVCTGRYLKYEDCIFFRMFALHEFSLSNRTINGYAMLWNTGEKSVAGGYRYCITSITNLPSNVSSYVVYNDLLFPFEDLLTHTIFVNGSFAFCKNSLARAASLSEAELQKFNLRLSSALQYLPYVTDFESFYSANSTQALIQQIYIDESAPPASRSIYRNITIQTFDPFANSLAVTNIIINTSSLVLTVPRMSLIAYDSAVALFYHDIIYLLSSGDLSIIDIISQYTFQRVSPGLGNRALSITTELAKNLSFIEVFKYDISNNSQSSTNVPKSMISYDLVAERLGNYVSQLGVAVQNIISQIYHGTTYYISSYYQSNITQFTLYTERFDSNANMNTSTYISSYISNDTLTGFAKLIGFKQVVLKNSSILILYIKNSGGPSGDVIYDVFLNTYNTNLSLVSRINITRAWISGPLQLFAYKDEICVGWGEYSNTQYFIYIVWINSKGRLADKNLLCSGDIYNNSCHHFKAFALQEPWSQNRTIEGYALIWIAHATRNEVTYKITTITDIPTNTSSEVTAQGLQVSPADDLAHAVFANGSFAFSQVLMAPNSAYDRFDLQNLDVLRGAALQYLPYVTDYELFNSMNGTEALLNQIYQERYKSSIAPSSTYKVVVHVFDLYSTPLSSTILAESIYNNSRTFISLITYENKALVLFYGTPSYSIYILSLQSLDILAKINKYEFAQVSPISEDRALTITFQSLHNLSVIEQFYFSTLHTISRSPYRDMPYEMCGIEDIDPDEAGLIIPPVVSGYSSSPVTIIPIIPIYNNSSDSSSASSSGSGSQAEDNAITVNITKVDTISPKNQNVTNAKAAYFENGDYVAIWNVYSNNRSTIIAQPFYSNDTVFCPAVQIAQGAIIAQTAIGVFEDRSFVVAWSWRKSRIDNWKLSFQVYQVNYTVVSLNYTDYQYEFSNPADSSGSSSMLHNTNITITNITVYFNYTIFDYSTYQAQGARRDIELSNTNNGAFALASGGNKFIVSALNGTNELTTHVFDESYINGVTNAYNISKMICSGGRHIEMKLDMSTWANIFVLSHAALSRSGITVTYYNISSGAIGESDVIDETPIFLMTDISVEGNYLIAWRASPTACSVNKYIAYKALMYTNYGANISDIIQVSNKLDDIMLQLEILDDSLFLVVMSGDNNIFAELLYTNNTIAANDTYLL